ncbi:8780_t:CDS:2 [Diversispora eburnea]|uniref:8780_t:CDS:1 n=1 Tax=Diversispora eburnea TaxID=1213867 RepID=A0A9N8WML2_9GLOM|nr:8780_t:CDS:2 [Diversispora eburnea]
MHISMVLKNFDDPSKSIGDTKRTKTKSQIGISPLTTTTRENNIHTDPPE